MIASKRRIAAAAAVLCMTAAGIGFSGVNAFADDSVPASQTEVAEPKSIADCKVSLAVKNYIFAGDPVQPGGITVFDGGKQLVRDNDFAVSFADNDRPGAAKLTITGIGDYEGSKELDFMILPANTSITQLTTGNGGIRVEWTPSEGALGYQVIYSRTADFKEYHSTTVTEPGRCYVNLTNVPKPGEKWYVKVRAFVTADGSVKSERFGNYTAAGEITTSSEIGKVTIPYISYTYTGKAITPTVKVKDKKGNLIPEDCYTVSYSRNVKVGTAKITVRCKGGIYTGSFTREFYVKPARNKITSLTSSNGGFKIGWEKGTKGTVGYQVLYSKTEDFSGDVHSYSSAVLDDLSENFSKVPKLGETWYVKVRSFVTKDGTMKSTRYGNYSPVMKIYTVMSTRKIINAANLYDTAHYQPTALTRLKAGETVGIISKSGNWYRIARDQQPAGWVYGLAFGEGSGVTRTNVTKYNVEGFADDTLFWIGTAPASIRYNTTAYITYSKLYRDSDDRNEKAAVAAKYKSGACYIYAAFADLLLDRAGYDHEIIRATWKNCYHNWVAYKLKSDSTWLYMETVPAGNARPLTHGLTVNDLIANRYVWDRSKYRSG